MHDSVQRRCDTKHHVLAITFTVLVVGLSISGGTVVWAVLVMLSPVVVLYMLGSSVRRGMVEAEHPSRTARPRR
jgi:uncharacterized membrane protein